MVHYRAFSIGSGRTLRILALCVRAREADGGGEETVFWLCACVSVEEESGGMCVLL